MVTNTEIMSRYRLENNIPDTIHLYTFGDWKRRGFHVKKGERSRHKVSLWTKVEKITDENGRQRTKCHMRTAYLFEDSQVEKIER